MTNLEQIRERLGKAKPCPFINNIKDAGHELYICREDEVSGLPRVGCTCGARGSLACGDDKSVIDAWNNQIEKEQWVSVDTPPKESRETAYLVTVGNNIQERWVYYFSGAWWKLDDNGSFIRWPFEVKKYFQLPEPPNPTESE